MISMLFVSVLFMTYHVKMTGGGIRDSRLPCFALHHRLPLLSLGGKAAVRFALGFSVAHHASLLAVHLLLRLSILGKSLLTSGHLLLVTESWREIVRVLQGWLGLSDTSGVQEHKKNRRTTK